MRARRILLHAINTGMFAVLAVTACAFPELYRHTWGRWYIVVPMVCSAAWGATLWGLVETVRLQRHMTRISKIAAARRGVPSGSTNIDTGDKQ